MDTHLPRRTIAIMLKDEPTALHLPALIEPDHVYILRPSDYYEPFDEDDDIVDTDRILFKHPVTQTWFYVANTSFDHECSTCDGDTSSSLELCEERSLTLLFRLHFTDRERETLFGDPHYLCRDCE
jgi:hypothetical protein